MFFGNDGAEDVSLETLGGGAAIEGFNDQLKRVVENVMDPNTDAKEARKITLTVSIKPNAERNFAQVSIKCVSKCAGLNEVPSVMFFVPDGKGKVKAVEPKGQ